jgi:hypothetical protein
MSVTKAEAKTRKRVTVLAAAAAARDRQPAATPRGEDHLEVAAAHIIKGDGLPASIEPVRIASQRMAIRTG